MSIAEDNLIKKIAEMGVSQNDARLRIAEHKRAALNAESDLIFASLSKEKLIEELRVLIQSTVNNEQSHIEKDTARFKEVLPELLKRIH